MTAWHATRRATERTVRHCCARPTTPPSNRSQVALNVRRDQGQSGVRRMALLVHRRSDHASPKAVYRNGVIHDKN